MLVGLTNISKTYKKGKKLVPVLTDINLEIQRGDFVALMGPSGSGKTTLLNLLGGLDSPSSGELMIARAANWCVSFHRAAYSPNGAHKMWVFIFQFYNLMPVLSAEKNVELPLFADKLS